MHIDSELYQEALGNELRRLRKRKGWTRRQLNSNMPSDISLQTLATYELGTRHCSVVRLAEICAALGEQPHQLLERVDRRMFAQPAGEVQINLRKVAAMDLPELLPLRRWAVNQMELDTTPVTGEVSLNLPAVERMAELCGVDTAELLSRLRDTSCTTTSNGH